MMEVGFVFPGGSLERQNVQSVDIERRGAMNTAYVTYASGQTEQISRPDLQVDAVFE